MSSHYSRREFLQSMSVGLLTLALSQAFSLSCVADDKGVNGNNGIPSNAPEGSADPAVFAALRQKWRDILIGTFDPRDPIYTAKLAAIAADAKQRQQSLDRSSDRQKLWPDTRRGASASVTNAYSGLYAMALAYATPGTGLTGDESLLRDVIAGLDLMQAHWYNATTKETGNWWDWEIGSPQLLTNICVLIYDKLSPEQRVAYSQSIDRFIPNPVLRTAQKNLWETGANRSDKCQNIAIRALLTDDAQKLTIARDGLSQIFKYVTVGDGYHADGSFIQHNDIPYTGTYGIVLLGGLARLFSFFAGSPWEVKDEGRKIVFDAIERTYAPFIYNGLLMDSVSGRAITRSGARDRGHGRGAMAAILLLAEGVPPEYAKEYRARVKGWLLRSNKDEFLLGADIASIGRAQAVLKDKTLVPLPEPTNHRLFHDMDRAVHRRPGWALGIAMCSSRIARYESSVNSENKRGWHTSDGMTYLYLQDDPAQFNADFWPTVNAYRLPGTTVDTQEMANNSGGGRPKTKWVGGACLGEMYGAVGMELEAALSTLRAKKSWFCLDNAIVCLGAGITSTDGRTIETIIENRNLTNRNLEPKLASPWQVDRNPVLGQAGQVTPTHVSWAHLEGVGGYLFPTPANLHAVRETRSGSWDEVGSINPSGNTVTRSYLTFWFDHGVNPTSASYAYALLPGATAKTTAQAAKKLSFEVLSNTETVQAIREGASGLVMANFWAPGAVAGIQVDGPCSVIIRRQGKTCDVALAEPSRTAVTVKVSLDFAAKSTLRADESVSTVQLSPALVFEAKTEKTRGKTHQARFSI